MIVKTLKKAAVVAAILSTATVANADVLGMKKFHVGADVMGTTLDWSTKGGKNIFPKNPMNFGAFVGAEFYNHNEFAVGLELGVEYMQRTKNNATIGNNQAGNLNASMGATDSSTYKTKLKMITPYLGLTGSYKITEQFKLIGMVGAGLSIVKMDQTETAGALAGVALPTPTVALIPTKTIKKNALTPIVRLGAQYDFNETFGIRANVGYRYVNAVKGSVLAGTTLKYNMQAKNSVFTYGAGVVFTF